MQEQTIFDLMYQKYKITKPIRLITLFSGYDSQALALKYLGVPFEHWKTSEWAVKSIQALKDLHFSNDNNDYSESLDIDQIKDFLLKKGISQNYNEPLNEKQIKKMSEKYARNVFNNIVATHNLVNIQQVKGTDLEIIDPENYCYLMTYSFPCQDLSNAGLGKGMSDTSTRSGMLWEVERILTECKELGAMPQILLMENVPAIHSEDNKADFLKWILRLEQLGYKNYWQDLIATDYGIPQTRNRCFMVSILGDYSYSFPRKQPLKLKLKDLLEDQVDEKYFLSDKMIDYVCSRFPTGDNKITVGINMANKENSIKAGTITTGGNDLGVVVGTYQFAKSDNFMGGKSRFQMGKETSDTLQTSPKEGVVLQESLYSDLEKQLFTEDGNIKRYIGGELVDEFKEGQMATTTYPNGYGHGPRTHNEAISLNTIDRPSVKQNLRIRKLTPRECLRLMGLRDKEIDLISKNQSDSSLYHLAGDSIVVDVLMAIFKELL